MKIKICGMTNINDAKLAEGLGADFIGLIFASSSKRCISLKKAKEIVGSLETALAVGVFVEQGIDEINAIADAVGLQVIQTYHPVQDKFSPLTIIEALRVKDERSLSSMETSEADYFLLDAHHEKSYGGTGKTFDWSLLPDDVSRCFIAGGLTPDNVAAACAKKPYGVDVCSGVESSPGIKDNNKLQRFFKEIHAV